MTARYDVIETGRQRLRRPAQVRRRTPDTPQITVVLITRQPPRPKHLSKE